MMPGKPLTQPVERRRRQFLACAELRPGTNIGPGATA